MLNLPGCFHVVAYSIFLAYAIFMTAMWGLQYKNIKTSIPDLESISDILQAHDEVEKRDEHLAILLGLTKEELKIELEQQDRLTLIGKKAASVTSRLKALFPIGR